MLDSVALLQPYGRRIEDLVFRPTLSPKLVDIEATGGFEAVVAAGLGDAGLLVVVVQHGEVNGAG